MNARSDSLETAKVTKSPEFTDLLEFINMFTQILSTVETLADAKRAQRTLALCRQIASMPDDYQIALQSVVDDPSAPWYQSPPVSGPGGPLPPAPQPLKFPQQPGL